MYKFIFAVVCCNFLLLMSGCAPASEAAAAAHQPGPESQACDAVKQAILAETRAPASTGFGPCDATSSNGRDYTVGVAIKIGHTDERGRSHADTFYYGSAILDPATHEMRASDLIHD